MKRSIYGGGGGGSEPKYRRVAGPPPLIPINNFTSFQLQYAVLSWKCQALHAGDGPCMKLQLSCDMKRLLDKTVVRRLHVSRLHRAQHGVSAVGGRFRPHRGH